MNEELFAASVLFLQSGTLFVSHKWFYQLFYRVCSAPADHQAISTTLAEPQREL
jgi:hypothetical protein